MSGLYTHPKTAKQAAEFTSTKSLLLPGGLEGDDAPSTTATGSSSRSDLAPSSGASTRQSTAPKPSPRSSQARRPRTAARVQSTQFSSITTPDSSTASASAEPRYKPGESSARARAAAVTESPSSSGAIVAGTDDADNEPAATSAIDTVSSSAGPSVAVAPTSLNVSGRTPKLVNLVATIRLGRRVDLKTIAMAARNAEYNPKRFAAVVLRLRDPRCACLVFRTGRVVVTGCRSETDARIAGRKCVRILQKLGHEGCRFEEFKIHNVVATCDAGFPIRLENLAQRHDTFCSYEPELFPGLVYRLIRPRVVLIVFVSGRVVLTGAKVREEIYAAWDMMYPVFVDFRKQDR